MQKSNFLKSVGRRITQARADKGYSQAMLAERGIDEDLKARDMLHWVAEMNNIKASTEEIVLREVVLV